MTWIKLDDAFDQHPKLLEVGPVAAWVFVRSLCYSGRNLTDGLITRAVARELAGSSRQGQRVVSALVAARLWEITTGGYAIHDFLEYQPSRASVLAVRLTKAEAGRLGGLRTGAARRSRLEAEHEAPAKHGASDLLEANGKANGKQNRTPVPGPVPGPDRAPSSRRSGTKDDGAIHHISVALAQIAHRSASTGDADEPLIP
ncbi:MAG: hypothetical protein E6K78_11485 [Candidatus Eisenbacteria bacterium]|uniref:Uncharacterized protein n=1 Tax=Eiseniibacteriota bacterium TaxID=2212470 RepID=A0A538TFZ2_UNCEI|nr:MAG: hypothetical protein E6K78_11485 [Candidatus Eisenbacteria bacterium]